MTRNNPTPEEHHASLAGSGSARVSVGAAQGYGFSVGGSYAGTLIPKHNTQAGDPTNPGSKQNRQNIERVGATYRVTAGMGVNLDPAAGATMANARIVPSIQGRVNPNFDMGIQSVQ
jgi:hypothetical protein